MRGLDVAASFAAQGWGRERRHDRTKNSVRPWCKLCIKLFDSIQLEAVEVIMETESVNNEKVWLMTTKHQN